MHRVLRRRALKVALRQVQALHPHRQRAKSRVCDVLDVFEQRLLRASLRQCLFNDTQDTCPLKRQ